jgi:hypothetical protein
MKILNLLSPKQNRIKHFESESSLKSKIYYLLGTSESAIRGGLIGSLSILAITKDTRKAGFAFVVGAFTDIYHHSNKLAELGEKVRDPDAWDCYLKLHRR